MTMLKMIVISNITIKLQISTWGTNLVFGPGGGALNGDEALTGDGHLLETGHLLGE